MSLKPYAVVSHAPETVVDEALAIVPGETRYWLLLDDAEVENLADGVVSEAVSRRAYAMTSWKREQTRIDARKRTR
jgi:hypothetical protein